jgi:tubulin delta
VRGVLTLQSVAGGTGSGLGSYLTEHVLRDTFPSALLLNAVVWPYASGEVIVQNYNALLTIASLTRAADGVVVLPNDTAHAECQRLLRLPRPSLDDRLPRPSFDDLNGVLATRLAAALLPVGDSAIEPMMEMGRQLCSHAVRTIQVK